MTKTHLMVCGVLVCFVCGISVAREHPAAVRDLNIEPQPLDNAINAWAAQTGYQVLMPAAPTPAVQSTPLLKGSYTPEGALKLLLASTDLKYQFVNDRTVSIGTNVREEDSSGRYRLAERDRAADAAPTGGSSTPTEGGLEEVIVSAQKRSERLQDVPVPVTAISAETLVDTNQLRLQDYFTKVPGLSVSPGSYGAPRIILRGLSTGGTGGGTNPTVGVVIDDVPYGSSTTLGGGSQGADFDPSDLERIEVLRGPQGTLYGANSLAGLVKYVTIDPATDAVSGRLQAGFSSVRNGDEVGYNVRGSVNVPISESVAIRASGFTRREPGFIDNVQTGSDAINSADADGGRLTALWRPSQDLSFKLSALIQETEANGSPYVHVRPGIGDLEQSTLLGTGAFDSKLQAYAATVRANIGKTELTSLSGYSISKVFGSQDYTFAFGPATQTQFGVPGTPLVDHVRTEKFTQELRLSVPLGEKLDWLIGAFYTDEDSRILEQIYAANPANGQVVGQWVDIDFPTTYSEYAAFTDLTIHFTDRFDLQLGGRESRNRQTYSVTWTGPYVPVFLRLTSPLIPPAVETKENAFTYLVTPRFKISPSMMVYARLASGYRPGGPNSNSTRNVLPTFESDKTQNYEIGMKADLFNNHLIVDTSIYYIQWKDIQLQLRDPISRAIIYDNAGRARSQGVELSLESRPVTGLSLSTALAYTDAVLTEGLPAGSLAVAASGERLPATARFSGSLSATQEFGLFNNMRGYVGATLNYVGERKGNFVAANAQRVRFPSYAQTDVRAGVKYDLWSTNIFVNNVTDKRGFLPAGAANPVAFYIIQPRTVGLSVVRQF